MTHYWYAKMVSYGPVIPFLVAFANSQISAIVYHVETNHPIHPFHRLLFPLSVFDYLLPHP